jgi:tryptophan synthase alpha chain
MIRFKSSLGLVAYVTCGDPDLETSREVVIAAIDAGADVIELGVPFSDPLADGPIIQRASQRAVEAGVTLDDVLRVAADVRRARANAGLIIFSYFNPILRYGLKKFCEQAQRAGVDGALITDLTLEEAGEYGALMKTHKLATIFLAAPTSTDERLRRIAEASQGFIYAVSRTGVTGPAHGGGNKNEAAQLVKRLRKFSKLPIAVGFGISSAADFRSVGSFADAAVVGSAIVGIIEKSAESGASAAETAALVAQWIEGLRQQEIAGKQKSASRARV